MFFPYDDLVEAYSSFIPTLLHLISQVSNEDGKKKYRGEKSWAIIEIICHLRDSELVALQRTQVIIREDEPLLKGFNPEDWATERKYLEQELEPSLKAFINIRTEHTKILKNMELGSWNRVGIHNEIGILSIYNHIVRMVAHDFIHSQQLVDLLNVRTKASTQI